MTYLVSFFFLLLAFQLVSASQYSPENSSQNVPKSEYPDTSAPKEKYPGNSEPKEYPDGQEEELPGNYSENKEEEPENYSGQEKDQPENYSEQKEEQPGNYYEQEKVQPGNYSEQKEKQPENYSEQKEQQPTNNSDKKEERPENYSEQKEEQPENYSEHEKEQPGNYSEQKEKQPENYSEQKEEQPTNYYDEKEEHRENYSEENKEQPGNDSEQIADQPGDYSEQKENHPENYSEQKEDEYDGNDNDEKDGPSLTIPTLLDSLDDLLSFVHYQQRCPQAESIINRKVKEWFKKDYTIAASLLRLHFHDCVVRGCDASILLDYEGSERRAEESKTLRGFEVIDDIKAEIEKHCTKTVSCADILTAASRDATVLLGGPYWMVPYGRKDGKVSVDKEAKLVPMGLENITSLIEFYQSNGLNVLDLVVLSGAHTIGRATCGAIQHRLYNFEGTGKPDPSLDTQYLNFLTRKCRWASEYVDLDGTTPTTFDNEYYKNLQKHMGLLSSDQLLFSDPRTAPLVNALASAPEVFYHQFGVSMAKLGNILVPSVLDDGEIRTVCSSVNSDHY